MKFFAKALGGLLAAISLALPVNAQVANSSILADLLNGGSITARDKLFDNWDFSFVSSDAQRQFNANNIQVTALADGGDNPGPGLQFIVSNGELTVTGDGVYAFVDLTLSFRVSVLSGANMLIKDNSLELTGGSVTGLGDNGFYIHESIGTSEGGSELGEKQVEFSWLDKSLGGPGLISELSDSAEFQPQSEIWVTKNILVWATGTDETATLLGFEQRFSQQPVPEPGSLALAALALAGLGVAARRRR